jgi:hypothetical protein
MNSPEAPKDWLSQARAVLDREVDAQDYALRSRLTALRRGVLQERERVLRPTRRVLRYLAVAATVCAIAIVAQLSWLSGAHPQLLPADAQIVASLASTDDDLLASSDSLDLYENLEFYAWLQSQPVDG